MEVDKQRSGHFLLINEKYLEGLIYKGVGGLYFVKTSQGLYECNARGIFKHRGKTLLVGDRVKISIEDAEKSKGIIEAVENRKTELIRPTVANVDQAVIVFALRAPKLNGLLMDKMIILAKASNLDVVLCLNKSDLDEGQFLEIQNKYRETDYPIVKTCAHSRNGLDDLMGHLKGKISVFSGPSGVGKSSLLNAFKSGFALEVGDLSKKISRGKHTTRHSELLELGNGGIVVDTPGFTSLSLSHIDPSELRFYFDEFIPYASHCQFDNCQHINEPKCGVKEAKEKSDIPLERYEAYVYIYEELIENQKRSKKW